MRKLFVIDDITVNIFLLRSELEKHYQVYILSTAEKLLSIADTVKPELILLAVKIPVTDGYGMIQELKNSKLTADIPIIAISSSIDCDVIAKCFELGVVDFIAKPIFANDLLNRIEHHFQN